MRKAARPHKPTRPFEARKDCDLGIRVFASRKETENDLIEFHWQHNGRPLRVVTSRNAMRVDFDLRHVIACHQTLGAACVAATRQWVEEVVKLAGEYSILHHEIVYRVTLPWPAQLHNGTWFSSAPEQDLTQLRGLPFWHDRVDAFVDDGTLSILVYRKTGQRMGYPDGSMWFDDDFRALVQRKAAEQNH